MKNVRAKLTFNLRILGEDENEPEHCGGNDAKLINYVLRISTMKINLQAVKYMYTTWDRLKSCGTRSNNGKTI